MCRVRGNYGLKTRGDGGEWHCWNFEFAVFVIAWLKIPPALDDR